MACELVEQPELFYSSILILVGWLIVIAFVSMANVTVTHVTSFSFYLLYEAV